MPPLTIMIKPASGLCNMRCAYCFYRDVSERRETPSYGIMSMDTLETLMRRAFAYAEEQIAFTFQGGEPTLAGKDYFRRVLALERSLNSRNLTVLNAIQTNGYQLDDEWIALLREGRFLTGVSVDGTRALHDAYRTDASGQPTYDRVMKTVAALKKAGVEVNALCVVNNAAALQPKAVFQNLAPHGYLQFIPCLDALDGARAEYSLSAEAYGYFLIETFALYERAWQEGTPVSVRQFDNWIGMLAGQIPESCAMRGQCGVYYLIEADGSVYPCDFYVLDAWRMGNIREDSFFRLEKSPVADRFRRESIYLPEECETCPWLHLCRNGCKRDREPLLSGHATQNRLCAGYRLFFERCSQRMRRLSGMIARQKR